MNEKFLGATDFYEFRIVAGLKNTGEFSDNKKTCLIFSKLLKNLLETFFLFLERKDS